MQPSQPSFARLWRAITPRQSTWRPLCEALRQPRCLHQSATPSLRRRDLYGPNPIFRPAKLATLHRVRRRYESSKPLTSSSTPLPSTSTSSSTPTTPSALNPDVPTYQMTFTCKACSTRSSHKISKQGYYHGTILITCPGCKARHLIADHLKIFSDKSVTLEDIMKEKGDLVRRATLAEGTEGQEDVDRVGDVEFWGEEAEQWKDEKGPEVKVGGPRVRLGKLGADGKITRD